MEQQTNTLRQRASRWAWRMLGELGQGSARIPALALATGVGLHLATPRTVKHVVPKPLNPPGPIEKRSNVPENDPTLLWIDQLLASKASNLGLQLRRQLAQTLVSQARAEGLDPLMVLAVMEVESEFDEDAISNRGARGLMQVRPATLDYAARRQGIRLSLAEIERDPVLSTRVAVHYLGRLRRSFLGNLDRALMAYNAGPYRLVAAMKKGETEHFRVYPRQVRRVWHRFRSMPPPGDLVLAAR